MGKKSTDFSYLSIYVKIDKNDEYAIYGAVLLHTQNKYYIDKAHIYMQNTYRRDCDITHCLPNFPVGKFKRFFFLFQCSPVFPRFLMRPEVCTDSSNNALIFADAFYSGEEISLKHLVETHLEDWNLKWKKCFLLVIRRSNVFAKCKILNFY